MLAPIRANCFHQAIRWCSEIFFNLKDILKNNNYSTAVGDEGGFASNFKNNYEPLEFLIKAIKKSKLDPEKDVLISLDVASSEFFDGKKYYLKSDNKRLKSSEMVEYLNDMVKKYPIFSIEDGCSEDDWSRLGSTNCNVCDGSSNSNSREHYCRSYQSNFRERIFQ